jgi:small subunit ribosomal protein S6
VRKYEVVFIVKPAEEEVVSTVVTKFENLITNNGGTIEKIDRWGKKRLAYEIKDHTEGYYTIIYFASEPQVVFELERVMKITDDVLKYMVVREEE